MHSLPPSSSSSSVSGGRPKGARKMTNITPGGKSKGSNRWVNVTAGSSLYNVVRHIVGVFECARPRSCVSILRKHRNSGVYIAEHFLHGLHGARNCGMLLQTDHELVCSVVFAGSQWRTSRVTPACTQAPEGSSHDRNTLHNKHSHNN